MAESRNIKKCPRKGCNNNAYISEVYGVCPCKACQKKDESIRVRSSYSSAHLSRLYRIQRQRDWHEGDMLQPFKGHKANPDFFKRYPSKIDTYGVREELARS